jgi:hypothetical protein
MAEIAAGALLAAVGDFYTLKLPRDFNGTVSAIMSGGAAPVGFVGKVRLSYDDGATFEDATLTRPDKSSVATVAQSQAGWCEAPGATHARLEVTARGSGTSAFRLEWRKG